MTRAYDAIVVGARCAGAPTAMLLARRGYRVLLVDRATFPSDTLSSHVVHPRGTDALARWGLLDRLMATGCPPIDTYSWDFGAFTIAGSPGTAAMPPACCPRRIVLDELLVEAAVAAGAELREGCIVEDLISEDGRVTGITGRTSGGSPVRERAEVVIGADGWHSRVAASVGAEAYHERPPLNAAYYSYWRDLPVENRFAVHVREARGFAVAPTHDGLTMIIGGWPIAEFETNRRDVEGTFLRMLDLVPSFGERVRAATRVARFAGATIPNRFRKPFGPGWALVGDAGYLKDSVTAQGITDAFIDAEACAHALDDVFTGRRSFDDALGDYQRARDERVMAMYEMTCQIASLQPPPPEFVELLAAISRNPEAMDGYARMNAGTISPAEFMSPANIGAILGATQLAG